MKHNLKSFWMAAASLTCLTASTYADTDPAQMRNLENRVSALEQRRGAGGVINPNARPEVKNGANMFVTADLLVWQAHEDGLPIYIEQEDTLGRLSDASVGQLDWDWNVGCRVGLGYNTPHDGWDLYAVWLHFNTDADTSERADSDDALYPTMSHPGATLPGAPSPIGDGPFQKASAHWAMNLNQIDLELGREFYVSKWLTLRPHMGLRTAWVRQHIDLHYNRLSNGFGGFSSGIDDALTLRSNFWGLGLEAGLNTQWGLGGGWSLYGDAGCSLLYGFHSLDWEDELSFQVESDWGDLDGSYRITRTVADLAMGIRFDTWSDDERVHFRIQAGWEHHVYFNQNQFFRFVDSSAIGNFVNNQGDLSLQGWTLAARLDF